MVAPKRKIFAVITLFFVAPLFCLPPMSEKADAGVPCVRPTRTFTSGIPTVWSPAPSPDITTVPTG